MSDAMKRALKWLAEHGGSGVITNRGFVLAGGEESRQFAPETWLRLTAAGILAGGKGRLAILKEGAK